MRMFQHIGKYLLQHIRRYILRNRNRKIKYSASGFKICMLACIFRICADACLPFVYLYIEMWVHTFCTDVFIYSYLIEVYICACV